MKDYWIVSNKKLQHVPLPISPFSTIAKDLSHKIGGIAP
jgi:hypothetical protein